MEIQLAMGLNCDIEYNKSKTKGRQTFLARSNSDDSDKDKLQLHPTSQIALASLQDKDCASQEHCTEQHAIDKDGIEETRRCKWNSHAKGTVLGDAALHVGACIGWCTEATAKRIGDARDCAARRGGILTQRSHVIRRLGRQ